MPEHAVVEPPDDVWRQLQSALGEAYAIERELAGGGMSRVFLARDILLDRQVVVKVLPPDLGGLNVDRFRREIQLAARLQHPHIVPVHTAGEMRGMLFYTMPFIEGESLRARLTRVTRLSVEQAVRVLADISDALAYAHEHGVIHRDIKPDNILLSRDHAVVTDFGVAKALRAAHLRRTDQVDTTGNQIAIGTPSYMAPEQVAGDPGTDHRADLYAFGALAYELLAGHPPFSGRTPRAILTAHLTERPVPIATLRPDTPPALAALVMRCLEKDPARRPQSAVEIRRALETLATQRAEPADARRRTRLTAAVLSIGALLTLIIALALHTRAPVVDENVVAVVPFRVANADSSLRYLREGMLDLLAAKLTGSGGPRSADPRRVLAQWRRAAGSDSADLPREQSLDLAEALGAGQLLLGTLSGTPEHLVLDASLLQVRDGRVEAQARVVGTADSLPRLVDLLAAKLLAIGAGEGEHLATLTSTSLPALQAYLDGQRRYRRARFREASRAFDRALQLDSTFALAALGLSLSSSWFGNPADERRGMQIAWSYRDRLSARDRALLEATAGPRFPAPSTLREMQDARERYLALAPDRAEAWFELGDGLLHFGAAIGIAHAHDSAANALRRALTLDSAFSPAVEHLVFLEAEAGDTAAVRRLGTLYLSLDSASENTDGVRWRMAIALRDTAALSALARRRATMSPVSLHTIQLIAQSDGVDLGSADTIARLRLTRPSSDALERYAAIVAAHDLALNRGHPATALALTSRYGTTAPVASAALRERVRDALFWDGNARAGAAAAHDLDRLTAGTPPSAEEPRQAYIANVCTSEIWRLMQGDTTLTGRRVEMLRSEARTSTRPSMASFSNGCAMILDALLASATHRLDARVAISRLDSLLRSGPGGSVEDVGNLIAARLLEATGDIPGALAAVRRRDYFLSRPAFLSTYLREEGRLAALAGDRDGAITAYRHYLALRSSPDGDLENDVRSIRAEVARLTRAGDVRGS